jgi:hypothetical protein
MGYDASVILCYGIRLTDNQYIDLYRKLSGNKCACGKTCIDETCEYTTELKIKNGDHIYKLVKYAEFMVLSIWQHQHCVARYSDPPQEINLPSNIEQNNFIKWVAKNIGPYMIPKFYSVSL